MIEIQTENIGDDDSNFFLATASRGGLTGNGQGNWESLAIVRAKQDLEKQERELSPVSPNWENTPEAELCRVGAAEVCVDFSPFMAELSIA